MEAIHLAKPITTLSGDSVAEIAFNFDDLKPSDYRHIIRIEARLKGTPLGEDIGGNTASAEFRMATAWVAAVHAPSNHLCLDDIDKISIQDLIKLEQIGLFFIAGVE